MTVYRKYWLSSRTARSEPNGTLPPPPSLQKYLSILNHFNHTTVILLSSAFKLVCYRPKVHIFVLEGNIQIRRGVINSLRKLYPNINFKIILPSSPTFTVWSFIQKYSKELLKTNLLFPTHLLVVSSASSLFYWCSRKMLDYENKLWCFYLCNFLFS
jgi:hypothetical protein